MTGVSGCFGSNSTIDNLEDVSATVEKIVESASDNSGDENAQVQLYYYQSVDRRIRLLTLAVVVLAVVILAREWK